MLSCDFGLLLVFLHSVISRIVLSLLLLPARTMPANMLIDASQLFSFKSQNIVNLKKLLYFCIDGLL